MKINNVKVQDSTTEEIELKLSPEDLAEIFWGMDDKQQSRFFCHLGDKPKKAFEMQMIAVGTNNQLTDNAKIVMVTIGECPWPQTA